jgi:hypothetical protein
MKRTVGSVAWLALGLCLTSFSAWAQTNLPGVTVTAPAYTRQHGGYIVSGDFKVDQRMPFVVFPAQALVKDDILSIQPVNLNDDEYLVLQECASADCSQARVVRVWSAGGATGWVHNSENRIWIRHENKYFIWLKRLPQVSFSSCDFCGTRFTSFDPVSPPLTLIPEGELAAHHQAELAAAGKTDPVRVAAQVHEGATYVVTFVGGSKVRIKRMHAAR